MCVRVYVCVRVRAPFLSDVVDALLTTRGPSGDATAASHRHRRITPPLSEQALSAMLSNGSDPNPDISG